MIVRTEVVKNRLPARVGRVPDTKLRSSLPSGVLSFTYDDGLLSRMSIVGIALPRNGVPFVTRELESWLISLPAPAITARMDEQLYTEDPFSISPNPLYLYLTPSLKATLHKIRYTINRRQGLTCVLGDVGYGKSTVLRFMYTEFAARETVLARLISSPNYPSEFAFLKSVSGEFDVPAKRSIVDQERELKAFLIEQYTEGRNVALFIDEAQRLSNKSLEIIRSMLNFETDDAKLIQIVLSGQIELRDRLVTDELKAIESRIVMPTVLNALSPGEMVDMIEFRCLRAEIKQPFTPASFQTIYDESGGIPRDVLKICGTAYEYMRMVEEDEIDPEMVTVAAKEARLKGKAANSE